MNYLLQCSTAIGVAVLLPFLGVSSLNFGPLATAAFFLVLIWEWCPQEPYCGLAFFRGLAAT
jgi:hypothetical protein